MATSPDALSGQRLGLREKPGRKMHPRRDPGALGIAERGPNARRIAIDTAQRLMLRREARALRLRLPPAPAPTAPDRDRASRRKPKYSRPRPGARCAAMSAASITSVPEPHMRIEEPRALRGELRPAGAQQNAGRDVLLQRRLARLGAIAAAVQAFSGQVDGYRHLLAVGVGVNPHVGAFTLHIGPEARPGAQSIADRILQLQGAEVGVGDLRMLAAEITGERRLRSQMARPVDAPRPRRRTHRRSAALKRGDFQEQPVGGARFQAHPVGAFQRALEGHPGGALADGGGTAGVEFLDQQIRQAARAAGDQ